MWDVILGVLFIITAFAEQSLQPRCSGFLDGVYQEC